MRTPQLTEWFPSDVKPVRVGVYQTKYAEDPQGFSYWTGKHWLMTDDAKTAAAISGATYDGSYVPYTQDKRWRGLAKEPK